MIYTCILLTADEGIDMRQLAAEFIFLINDFSTYLPLFPFKVRVFPFQ